MSSLPVILIAYAAVTMVMSLVTVVLYGYDKRQAGRAGWRVSEGRLHLFALFGGWPGAWLGQRVFRHKTQKLSFKVVLWTITLLHLAGIGGLIYWAATATT